MGPQFSIKAMLAAFSAANKRTFAHDRTKSVGGSDVGQCLRKTWFNKHVATHGFQCDEGFEQSSGATDRGSVYEDEVWAPALRAHRPAGSKLLFAGENQETLHKGLLSATPDGLFINLNRDCLFEQFGIADIGPQSITIDPDTGEITDISPYGCLVAECKTIDPRVNLKGEEKAEHGFQVNVQCGLIRAGTKYRPNFGVITYTNASFLDDVKEFLITYDPAVFAAAEARAALVMSEKDPSRIQPEGKWSKHAKECKYCSYTEACAAVSIRSIPGMPANKEDAAPVLTAEQEATLDHLARQVATQADAEDLAERGKKIAQQKVRDYLREIGTNRASLSTFTKISWAAQSGRTNYDMDAVADFVAKAGGDMADFEKPIASFDRLNVTVYSADEVADKLAAEAAETAAREQREQERAEKAAAKESERLAKEEAKAEKARIKAEDDAFLASLTPAERKAEKTERARLKTLTEAADLIGQRDAEAISAGL